MNLKNAAVAKALNKDSESINQELVKKLRTDKSTDLKTGGRRMQV